MISQTQISFILCYNKMACQLIQTISPQIDRMVCLGLLQILQKMAYTMQTFVQCKKNILLCLIIFHSSAMLYSTTSQEIDRIELNLLDLGLLIGTETYMLQDMCWIRQKYQIGLHLQIIELEKMLCTKANIMQ